MCGIAGIINLSQKPVDEQAIRTMMQAMKHRGPDDEGVCTDGNTGFGFVRLSILDLSPLGHQPMFDKTGRWVIIHNGEVYNYLELRKELEKKGYTFVSGTDTEVILYSFIHWGNECLNYFNGMWAFAIYDTREKELFISRDRFGIKPFYYYANDDVFIFASEITPILKILKRKPSANDQAIFDFLVFSRTDQGQDTFFDGIKKLMHGHFIKINTLTGREIKPGKWYDLRAHVRSAKPYEHPEEYLEALVSSIGFRLRSDVPVGVCFSGGLDSSTIVSILLNRFSLNGLNTFSSVYDEGEKGDETDYINEYRAQLKNMFFTTPTAGSLLDDLGLFIEAHGEPVPTTSPYAQFKVMELAGKHVVVTLDGQGADEQFAGYHYFFGYYFKELFTGFRWLRLMSEMNAYAIKNRSALGIKSFLFFMLPQRLMTGVRASEKGYVSKDLFYSNRDKNLVTGNIYHASSLNDALINHFDYKLEHMLKWEDRNSMHFSIEARVPFLDHNLVEKILVMEPGKIIHKGITKYFMREAIKSTVPEKISTRLGKIGFLTPQDTWFRDDRLVKLAGETLLSETFKNRGIADPAKVNKIFHLHRSGKKENSKELWKLMSLELWFRRFID